MYILTKGKKVLWFATDKKEIEEEKSDYEIFGDDNLTIRKLDFSNINLDKFLSELRSEKRG